MKTTAVYLLTTVYYKKSPRDSRPFIAKLAEQGNDSKRNGILSTKTTATMALLSSASSPFITLRSRFHLRNPNPNSLNSRLHSSALQRRAQRFRFRSQFAGVAASNICEQETLTLDTSSLIVKEYFTEAELLAAVRLRIRTFYEFNQETFNVEVVEIILLNFESF